jgi:hypothetical protein
VSHPGARERSEVRKGTADWLGDLVGPADRDRLEPVVAWGTPMLLDTSYRAQPTSPPATTNPGRAPPGADRPLPQVGPIFA